VTDSASQWTVKEALDWIVGFLAEKGDEHPRRSAEWIISAATGLTRLELYAYHDRPLSATERFQMREAVKARAKGVPLQYVTGEMPFRRIVIKVANGVFIPRPETEILVEEGLAFLGRCGGAQPVVVDLCTGSGCVACSIASEDPSAIVYAVDICESAVRLATENASRLGLDTRVTVLCGDLLTSLPSELEGSVDMVLANPPYIPTAEMSKLPGEVRNFEPSRALDGGEDGLVVARRIIEEAARWIRPGGMLAMELDEFRTQDAIEAMAKWFEESRIRDDLVGRKRFAIGLRR